MRWGKVGCDWNPGSRPSQGEARVEARGAGLTSGEQPTAGLCTKQGVREGLREPGWSGEAKATPGQSTAGGHSLAGGSQTGSFKAHGGSQGAPRKSGCSEEAGVLRGSQGYLEEVRVLRGSQSARRKSGFSEEVRVLRGSQGALRKSGCLEEVGVLRGISLEQRGPGAPASSSHPATQLTHRTD